MEHSKTLEETKLWQTYIAKTNDYNRVGWTKEAYKAACNQLKAVRDTFKNYTLHDETHVLNVMDAMAGLLGNRIDELKAGEAELLILASAFHDLGMVYTEDEINNCLSDDEKLRKYFSTHPDMRDKDKANWQQDYLRCLHPFRVDSVLQQPNWQAHFGKCPKDVVPENIIIAVCRAHGESPKDLVQKVTDTNGILRYKGRREIDPLFCAILLRLADILDFDDSRAPSVLFDYAKNNEKSIEEWEKHRESMGFLFPDVPSVNELLYGAQFTNPTVERSARNFLDVIDEELSNSRGLLVLTQSHWKDFPFPYQINRSEIERVGYDFGDFKITMDQERILEMLVGENLYSDPSVFVRELLQNSIDATLTRAEMDSTFTKKINTDEARIDLWEWLDDEGDLWFRIDDFGTGMTRGMLEKYFLKAGNSYYNSKEYKKDLNGKSYQSISRFGIGFLSCFLCGVEAYVSTNYWNPEKNIREAECNDGIRKEQDKFGLRLDVVGLNEYYTLKNQAILDNHPSPLPSPPITSPRPDENLEKDGYRVLPGTSIAIRIDSGKLGSISLLNTAREWACYPRMPIYFNGKRLSKTFDEMIYLARKEQGVKEYDLSDEEKKSFDDFVPELSGNYPKIKETIKLFEADQVIGLPNLKLLLFETLVLFPSADEFMRGGRRYTCSDNSKLRKPRISIYPIIESEEGHSLSFQSKDNRQLPAELSSRESQSYLSYGWKGIKAIREYNAESGRRQSIIVLDEDDKRPNLKVNRDSDARLPLKTAITILAWLEKGNYNPSYYTFKIDFDRVTLKEWKAVLTSAFCDWMGVSTWKDFAEFKKALEQGLSPKKQLSKRIILYGRVIFGSMSLDPRWIFIAYLQIHYRIVVDYSTYQLSFRELDSTQSENLFDLFPIMPFCYGEKAEDRRILCSAKSEWRIAITANHDFMIWLQENAEKLFKYYPRQFEQIILRLKWSNAEVIIESINEIIEQISKTSFRHGIDTTNCPKLTMDDFDMTDIKPIRDY